MNQPGAPLLALFEKWAAAQPKPKGVRSTPCAQCRLLFETCPTTPSRGAFKHMDEAL
jgi:hypothetical protein